MLLEPVEARLPLSLLLADPTDQLLHALDVQPARSPLTVDPLLDQPAAPEDADVAGDGLVCQVEWLGEFANGRLAPGEPADDRPTGTVAQGSEGGIQVGVDVEKQSSRRSTVSATRSLCKCYVARLSSQAVIRAHMPASPVAIANVPAAKAVASTTGA